MKIFLAYFDLLGFKKFIENNDEEHLNRRTGHLFTAIERALALDLPLKMGRTGALSDISQSTLNCLNFSDTVVFWTQGNTLKDFEEIIRVAHEYNRFNVCYDFPSRGCLVYGDTWWKPFSQKNIRNGTYTLNMIYGRALIDAHLKAESQDWAGCTLDKTAFEFARTLGNIDELIERYTMMYDVPYKGKDTKIKITEHAFTLGLIGNATTEFIEDGIRSAFTGDKKGEIEGRTKEIFDNTIEFLRAHK